MKAAYIVVIALLLAACGKQQQVDQINLADYGLSDSADIVPAVLKALDDCKMQSITKLVIPPGTWHLYPERAFEKFCHISNNDDGLKRIAFPLINVHNFEIEGQGAHLIFHGHMVPFVIENSTNIKISNLSIDWDKPFNFQAEVVAVDPKAKTFDVRVFSECDYKIVAGEILFNSGGIEQNMFQNLWFDPRTKATVYNVVAHKIDPWNPDIRSRYSARELEPGLIRVLDTVAALPEPGWIWVAKGRLNKLSRISPAVHMYKAENIAFENVKVYHCGGMAFIAERCRHIELKKTDVMLAPDSKRLVSSTADATHFVNCRGKIVLNSSCKCNFIVRQKWIKYFERCHKVQFFSWSVV